jgi:hypothetical protein
MDGVALSHQFVEALEFVDQGNALFVVERIDEHNKIVGYDVGEKACFFEVLVNGSVELVCINVARRDFVEQRKAAATGEFEGAEPRSWRIDRDLREGRAMNRLSEKRPTNNCRASCAPWPGGR